MKTKKFFSVVTAVAAAALVLSSVPAANAAPKPASKAMVGDDCTKASVGRTAPGRGADGSDLTCLVVTTGTFKGQTKWWYKNVKPISKLEWVASSGVGGGYGTTAIAFADAMKAEGMLGDYTVSYKSGG